MKKLGALRWTTLGVLLGLVAGGAISWAAIPSSPGSALTACYPTSGPSKGALRVIDYQAGQRCASGEATVSWPQKNICAAYPRPGVDWSMPGSTAGNGCNFTSAYLAKQVLPSANLTNIRFASADLSASTLSGANMTGANAVNANFTAAKMTGVNLTGANLSGALLGSTLSNANFSGANLANARLYNSTLSGATGLTSAQLRTIYHAPVTTHCGSTTSYYLYSTHLEGLDLSGFDLSAFALGSARLDNADLSGTNLTRATLAAASLSSADLSNANLTCANLNGAITSGATFTGATWSNTICPDGTNSDAHGNTCIGHL